MPRRLYRSETDVVLGGVCGGLAEYLEVDPTLVRLVFVLLVFAGGVGLVAYIVLWIIMPRQSRVGAPTPEVVRENVEQLRERARDLGEEVRGAFAGPEEGAPAAGPEGPPAIPTSRPGRGAWLIGGVLILLGVVFLLENFRFFSWLTFGRLWPLILVIIGIALLWRR